MIVDFLGFHEEHIQIINLPAIKIKFLSSQSDHNDTQTSKAS